MKVVVFGPQLMNKLMRHQSAMKLWSEKFGSPMAKARKRTVKMPNPPICKGLRPTKSIVATANQYPGMRPPADRITFPFPSLYSLDSQSYRALVYRLYIYCIIWVSAISNACQNAVCIQAEAILKHQSELNTGSSQMQHPKETKK